MQRRKPPPVEPSMFRSIALVTLLAAGCASTPAVPADGSAMASLPQTLTQQHVRDLRGPYRAALCARPGLRERCVSALQRFAGESQGIAPAHADPSRYRLLFVPGFLASCFPGIASFADVIDEARREGFDAKLLEVGGRNSIAANAELVAQQIAAQPDDGRRIVIVGHSKGAIDALEALVLRPDLAARVIAVIGVAGAFQGSPLAERLRVLYDIAIASNPLLSCAAAQGDALDDMRPSTRRKWWERHGPSLRVPVYALVAVPNPDRVSPLLALLHSQLGSASPWNDGQLIALDQIPPGGSLLGFVNADHLTAGVPRPSALPWSAIWAPVDYPRADVILAAVDVAVADAPPAVQSASARERRVH
jgi:pimeloyl-ACP methyl ester carboxylesterase